MISGGFHKNFSLLTQFLHPLLTSEVIVQRQNNILDIFFSNSRYQNNFFQSIMIISKNERQMENLQIVCEARAKFRLFQTRKENMLNLYLTKPPQRSKR